MIATCDEQVWVLEADWGEGWLGLARADVFRGEGRNQ